MDANLEFYDEIVSHGWDPGTIFSDGKIHRFNTGRAKDRAGWYVFFGEAGAFGNWRGGSFKWSSRNGNGWTNEQQAEFKAKMEQVESDRATAKSKAKKRAEFIWKKATAAGKGHAYLRKKGIKPYGARQYKGALVLPVRAADGTLKSIQLIAADGTKRFLKDGEIQGNFFEIQGDKQRILCEGYATAASIHSATGATVVVAFNSGNLLAVGKQSKLDIIAGDHDAWTRKPDGSPWNPGKEKALSIGWEQGIKIAIPQFSDVENKPTDFNDLQSLSGLPEVKKQINGAKYAMDFLLAESETDKGAPYRPEHLQGMKLLKERDKASYMALRQELKRLKIGVTELERDISKPNNDNSGRATDHLSLAEEVITEYGKENLIFTKSFTWKWDESGLWKIAEDREIKKVINRKIKTAIDEPTRSAVDSVLDFLKTEIFRPDHVWDKDIDGINCQNGHLTWDNGAWKLLPHDRKQFRTSQIPVKYNENAQAPNTEKYLMEIFEEDSDRKDKIRLVCELLGYSLLSSARYEKFVILIGSGSNGKSVLLNLLRALAGPKNTAGVQPSKFDSPFQRAYLLGKLVNIVSELAVGETIKDDVLKSITSGEQITCERKFQDPFDLYPFCTIWFSSNHMPRTRDFSPALFRRALIVTFNRSFSESEQDKNLQDTLITELPGVLNLALAAFGGVLRRGFFTEPESCKEAKKDWRINADQAAEFVRDECLLGANFSVSSKRLYSAYKFWAEGAGIRKTLARNSFTTRVCNLGGIKPFRTEIQRMLSGIDIQDSAAS